MMNVLYNFDDLRKHYNLFNNSLDDSFLNFNLFVSIVDFLNNSLSSNMDLLILNWCSDFNFRVNFFDNFACNELFDFVCNFFDLLAANFDLNWHLLNNFNLFNLLDDISLHSFLSNRHINWNFLIVEKVNDFWYLNQLRSDDDLIDRHLNQFFVNLVDNFFLFQINFFGHFDSVMDFNYLLLDDFNNLWLINIFNSFRSRNLLHNFSDNWSFNSNFSDNQLLNFVDDRLLLFINNLLKDCLLNDMLSGNRLFNDERYFFLNNEGNLNFNCFSFCIVNFNFLIFDAVSISWY